MSFEEEIQVVLDMPNSKLSKKNSNEVEALSAGLTEAKVEVFDKYKQAQTRLHAAMHKAQQAEKIERDKDASFRAKEQKIGIGRVQLPRGDAGKPAVKPKKGAKRK